MALLLAGHDTTALALTWAFVLRAQYSEVEARLQAAVVVTLRPRHAVPMRLSVRT